MLQHRPVIQSFAKMASTSSALPEYEVEQKFSLSSAEETLQIEGRLRELGFEKMKSPDVRMVDWYWDDIADTWALTRQDCWLRLREVQMEGDSAKKWNWQLKLGRTVPTKKESNELATVYEEISGTEAVSRAMSIMFSSQKKSGLDIHNQRQRSENLLAMLDLYKTRTDYQLPREMLCPDEDQHTPLLGPFAMIETTRSTWISSDACSSTEFKHLKIDFDNATYGPLFDGVYAVGEVEEVVHDENDIEYARSRVQTFTKLLVGSENENKGNIPVGKLENFMMQHRPEHFQALVDNGIMS